MLNKASGLCRALYIILAIIAAFVPMGGMNVALILLVLGMVSGISIPDDRVVLAAATLIALPIIGAALTKIPQIGEQLNAIAGNLGIAIAGGVAVAIGMRLYRLAIDGVTGLTAAK